jgi:tetratricopeptide (TPR) repeat protein
MSHGTAIDIGGHGEDYEAAWDGSWTIDAIERFLEQCHPGPSTEDRRALLAELAARDLDLHLQAGHAVTTDDYLRRYPDLRDDPVAVRRLRELAAGRRAWCGPGPAAPHGYQILEELGRGGMGIVYKARQIGLDRLCALKMVRTGKPLAEVARFQTEARAIARLQHPHIVQVIEAGEYEGTPFLSLELCAGGSLDKKLAGTPLGPHEAARLVGQLARGMHAAHEAGVLHRDLKPANVLLTADGTPKITDFGLAKVLGEGNRTLTGEVMGTPSYMAPEQARGSREELGSACDVYALGAILYEMLTGRPPFKAATPVDTLRQVLDDDPVPPRRLQSGVPRDLETIGLKCLHKSPARRYASAAALADDLERFLQGKPIQARPVGYLEHCWRGCRRRPMVAGLVAVLLLVLIGGSIAVTFLWRRAVAGERQAEQEKEEALQLLADSVALLSRDNPGNALNWLSSPVDFLNQAEARYRALLDRDPDNPRLQRGLGEVHFARADLLFSVGERESAVPDLESALALWQRLAQADAHNLHFRTRLCRTRHFLGCVYEGRGQPAQAVECFQEAHRLARSIHAEQPVLGRQLALVNNGVALSRSLAAAGRREESLAIIQELRTLIAQSERAPRAGQLDAHPATIRQLSALLTRFGDDPPGGRVFRSKLASELITVCVVLRQVGEHAEAVRLGEGAVRMLRKITKANPNELVWYFYLGSAWHALGKARWAAGQREPALDALRQAVANQRQLFEKEPLVDEHRVLLSKRYDTLVHFLLLSGKLAEAEGCFLEHEKLWPQDAERLREVASDLRKLAEAVGKGRPTLTPAEQAERQRYLGQSERVALKAEALARGKRPGR